MTCAPTSAIAVHPDTEQGIDFDGAMPFASFQRRNQAVPLLLLDVPLMFRTFMSFLLLDLCLL